MTPLQWLQLLGLAVTGLYCLIVYLCYKLWHYLPDDKKVWAIALWIFAMGIGSFIAIALPGYQEGQ